MLLREEIVKLIILIFVFCDLEDDIDDGIKFEW